MSSPLDELLKLEIQAIRIVDVDEDSADTVVHNFLIPDIHGESNPLYFVAHRGNARRTQPSALTGIRLWEDWRNQFDCIRDITALNWEQFAEIPDPSKIADTPCRRCGEIAKVPVPPDALCGAHPAPRKRNSPGYNRPILLLDQNCTNKPSTSIPLEDRTGAIEGRNHLETKLSCSPPAVSTSHHPPSLFRLNEHSVTIVPPFGSRFPTHDSGLSPHPYTDSGPSRVEQQMCTPSSADVTTYVTELHNRCRDSQDIGLSGLGSGLT